MSRLLLPLCLFGLLLITSCSSSTDILVSNASGSVVGSITVMSATEARYIQKDQTEKAWLRGPVVRDNNKKRIGRIEVLQDQVRILTNDGTEAMILENGTECIDKNGTLRGKLHRVTEPEVAGGACLAFFVF